MFAAVSASGQDPTTEYVVAADDLPAGRVIGATDLDTVAIDLPAAQAGAAYRDPSSLVGTITLAPVAEGELLQASAIGAPRRDGVPTVAMSLPAAAALGGDLRPGDRVDAYVTFGSELDATTEAGGGIGHRSSRCRPRGTTWSPRPGRCRCGSPSRTRPTASS